MQRAKLREKDVSAQERACLDALCKDRHALSSKGPLEYRLASPAQPSPRGWAGRGKGVVHLLEQLGSWGTAVSVRWAHRLCTQLTPYKRERRHDEAVPDDKRPINPHMGGRKTKQNSLLYLSSYVPMQPKWPGSHGEV